MKKNNFTRVLIFVSAIFLAVFLLACAQGTEERSSENKVNNSNKTGKIRIGFSMDTLKEERWQRDRDLFVKRAKA